MMILGLFKFVRIWGVWKGGQGILVEYPGLFRIDSEGRYEGSMEDVLDDVVELG